MNIRLINIGDELLIGQVINTNASWMAQQLVANGMEVVEILTISDQEEAIKESLGRCLKTSDAVILTGGLGPTKDDITKKTLCTFFNTTLVEDAATLENIACIFEKRGYPMTPTNRQQALVPEISTVLTNKLGTAPGMWFEKEGCIVVSLPGVPFEMQYLMSNEVIPKLLQHFNTGYIIHKNLLFQGIGESILSDTIENWELALPKSIKPAYLPKAGLVRLRLTARGEDKDQLEKDIQKSVTELYTRVGEYIVGEDAESLAEVIAQKIKQSGKTLAIAESCTGGAVASDITALAGASEYFKGGVVAYANEVKESVLGVRHNTLLQHGAVSEETATEMVIGIRELMSADYAIATTGIAGPGGGTPEKPVGTVWIAVASKNEIVTQKMTFGNDRIRTIERSVNQSFSNLLKLITKELCGK